MKLPINYCCHQIVRGESHMKLATGAAVQ